MDVKNLTAEQKIIYTLRIACAMCFIGHGAFGLITKAVWCNYFGVFGIGAKTAYSLMPVVGSVDIFFGLLMLLYPLRAAFAWLFIWALFTAMLRPLSGEPIAEMIERAGNYGAPLLLLTAIMLGEKKRPSFFSKINSNVSLSNDDYRTLIIGLQAAAFLLVAAHGWLNLIAKKSLIAQYTALHFSDPLLVSQMVGVAEITAAFALLLKPSPALVLGLFVWKMSSELFYPSHELFEWVERGGSYGVLLALWFALRNRTILHEEHRSFFLRNPFLLN